MPRSRFSSQRASRSVPAGCASRGAPRASQYDRYIVEHSYNIYGSTLVKLPTPRYTVLYNGTSKQPAFMKLKLSDAFIHEDTSGDFEWTANMVNINHGMNDELLNNCRPLQEYMLLI